MAFVNSLHRCCSAYQPLVGYTKHVLCMCLVSVTVLRPQLYDCCMSRCLMVPHGYCRCTLVIGSACAAVPAGRLSRCQPTSSAML
jgi:hypothetical protein